MNHESSSFEINVSREAPNCLGFALFTLGIVPIEGFIHPGPIEIIDQFFDRVDSLEEADAVAAIQDLNQGRERGSGPEWYLSHMAVVDKQRPGYVIQVAFQGAPVEELKLDEAFEHYTDPTWPEGPHELMYLKIRQPAVMAAKSVSALRSDIL